MQPAYLSKSLTVDQARSLGVYDRHKFSPCEGNYRGEALYVLKFTNGIKIGIAKNLVHRLGAYHAPWVQKIEDARYYKTPQSRYWEQYFLKVFRRGIVGTRSKEYVLGHSFEQVINKIESNGFYEKFSR